VRCTPLIVASNATISATPTPTPTAVRTVRAARRRRLRQMRAGQVTRQALPQRRSSAALLVVSQPCPSSPDSPLSGRSHSRRGLDAARARGRLAASPLASLRQAARASPRISWWWSAPQDVPSRTVPALLPADGLTHPTGRRPRRSWIGRVRLARRRSRVARAGRGRPRAIVNMSGNDGREHGAEVRAGEGPSPARDDDHRP